jgi:VanZ family protein
MMVKKSLTSAERSKKAIVNYMNRNSPLARMAQNPWIGITALYALLLAPFDTGHTEIAKVLADASHGPLFALVAIFSLKYLRRTNNTIDNHWIYFKALVIAVLLGVFGESAQCLFTTTRYAQAKDVLTDTFGAIAALTWFAQRDATLRIKSQFRPWLIIATTISIGSIIFPVAFSGALYFQRWYQLPVLVTFDSASGYHFLHAGNSSATRATIPTPWNKTPNETALLILPLSEGRWAGVALEEPAPRWGNYSYLVIDLINPNAVPLELNLRIDDRKHNQEFNDRFNRVLRIPAQTRTSVKIPLNEIAEGPTSRQLDTSAISKLVLFEDTQHYQLPFYLCSIQLE